MIRDDVEKSLFAFRLIRQWQLICEICFLKKEKKMTRIWNVSINQISCDIDLCLQREDISNHSVPFTILTFFVLAENYIRLVLRHFITDII